MKPASGSMESTVDRRAKLALEPTFLVTLDPWHRVFLGNLADFFWSRRPPALVPSSRPGAFWLDVFVASHLPWYRFLESAFGHVAVILTLWGFGQLWPRQPRVIDRPVFRSANVIYYSASEYLPPINTGVRHTQRPRRGEPEYASQPIISVPAEADNNTQTIVTPPDARLNRDVPLPNIVTWSGAQPAVPLAATSGAKAELKLPVLPTSVVAPAPELNAASAARTMQGPAPAIVAPPPSVEAASNRKWGDINIGHTAVVAPAPQLPVTAQRTFDTMAQSAGSAVVPPPPSMGGGVASNGGGRIIALSIHPAVLSAPIEVPAGNRRGTFAATPEGKSGAAGTPNAMADAKPGNGSGDGSGANTKDAPPGLYVGGSSNPANSAAAGGASGNGTGGATQPSGSPRLLAEAAPPRVTSPARRPALEISDGNTTELERKVFGDRTFYSMTLNMPNLNSAGGSWVIRFAELHENQDQGELVAPLATQKVDPAYPLELMRRSVQGTVTLYAVIRSDGSVGDVRVLRGVDDRLDEYARTALSGWRFHPATKNGAAVDLEAVVMIPFRALRMKTGF